MIWLLVTSPSFQTNIRHSVPFLRYHLWDSSDSCMLSDRAHHPVAHDPRCPHPWYLTHCCTFSHSTLVFYLVVMLLYIFLELPAIQLFAVHRKRSEANFIRRYHLVMFILTLFCVTFQVLVHSSHRYSTLYARPNAEAVTSSHPDMSHQQQQQQQQNTKKQRSSEKLLDASPKARNPSPTPTTLSSATSPATSAAPAAAATSSATHLTPIPLHARGASSPTLKRSFS